LAEDKVWSFVTTDTTAPTVALTAPAEDGAAVMGASISLEAAANDNAGIDRVEFLVDGKVVETDASTGDPDSYSASWDSTSISDGSHLVEVRAYDTSGQTATSSRTVIVDNTAPTGSVLINSEASSTKKSSVALTISADDHEGSGLKRIRFSNDGTNWSNWEPYATTKRGWALARGKGTKTVYVELEDTAGNSVKASDTIKRR
jgi:hypothetical protein